MFTERPYIGPCAPPLPLNPQLARTDAGHQCFTLPAAGWTGDAVKGFKYKGKNVPGGLAAVSAVLKQSPKGVFLQKTVLKGKFVEQITPLLVANQADVELHVGGGDAYCGHFGGVVKNDAKLFKGTKAPAPANCAASACVAVCGDGLAQSSEACDEGGDTATCDADCTAPACGDGHVNAAAGEVCDPPGSAYGSGAPSDNGLCDGCLSPSGAFLSLTLL